MTEKEQILVAIQALEAQRGILGDAIVDVALAPLKEKLDALSSEMVPKIQEGERKLVTIMFADLSGFTALSEKSDPEKVRELMNACFDSLVPIVEKYGGVIDKFIGDEIMALFGAPVAMENDAERALRAALEMMETLKQFNRKMGVNLGMHFGINTGLVVAGGLGSEGRQQYSVMGDAVNLAARLEGASESGEIFVGPNTYKLTSNYFEFKELSPISLKGKSEPVIIYQLLDTRKEEASSRGIKGLRSPMVGRDKEISVIKASIEELETGKGGIISVFGEAGLGKSRLLAEAKLAFHDQIRWVEGRGISYAEGNSYHVVNAALDHLIGIAKEDAPSIISKKLKAFLRENH